MNEQETAKKDIWYNNVLKWIKEHVGFLICLGVCLCGGYIALHAFHQFHDWDFSYPADHEQWGLYGDFVGGVIGTIVAVFSVYFLVDTLRSQQEAIKKEQDNFTKTSVVYTVQQFDNNYNQLVKLYKEIIDGYKCGSVFGRDALKRKVEELYKEEYQTDSDYGKRVVAAQELFDKKFYIENRQNAAVHFRVLYRIFDLIERSGLDEKDYKVKYAKLVRCQLDENELVMLRYNCGGKCGEQMRRHINHYNLLKHLPPLSLLEFKYWREKVIIEPLWRNALDTELIAQRKWIIERVGDAEISKDLQYNARISGKYELVIEITNEKKNFSYILIRKNDEPSLLSIDRALDALMLKYDYARDFIVDFLHEVFEYSNFEIFNKFSGITYYKEDSSTIEIEENKSAVKVLVSAKSPIVLRYSDSLKISKEETPQKELKKYYVRRFVTKVCGYVKDIGMFCYENIRDVICIVMYFILAGLMIWMIVHCK